MKRIILAIFSICILTVLIVAPIAVNRKEQYGSLVQARESQNANLATLSQGITNYSVTGTKMAPCVIFVHGASGPMSVWNKNIPALANSGHRVITYDLLGRGLSDRPNVEYNLELYRQQLEGLISSVQCQGRINLVGSSMGAIVATDFALANTSLIRHLVIIGPAGFKIKTAPSAKLLQIPLIGEYAISIIGKKSLIKHNKKYYANASLWPEAADDYAQQFQFSGYKRALLSTMRHMPMNDFSNGYEKLGNTDIETLLIWGKNDITFPYSNFEFAQTLIKPIHAITIENRGTCPTIRTSRSRK